RPRRRRSPAVHGGEGRRAARPRRRTRRGRRGGWSPRAARTYVRASSGGPLLLFGKPLFCEPRLGDALLRPREPRLGNEVLKLLPPDAGEVADAEQHRGVAVEMRCREEETA